jgi:putative selenium metabolism hydrolase
MTDEELIALTQELVRTPSPTYQEGPLAELLVRELKGRLDEVWVDDAGNVLGILDGGRPGPTILFNGHMDHVDPGDMPDPYSGALMDGARFGTEGQVIYGRAAMDMKGALAAMVAAVDDLKRTGFAGRLLFTAVVQEEPAVGFGARAAVRNLLARGERPAVAVIGEATNGNVYLGHRGRLEFEVTTFGRTAHASNPDRGINAVYLMAEFIRALPTLPLPEHPLAGRCTYAVTRITCSPGRLSVVPDRCDLTLDVRYLPGEPPDRPEADLKAILTRLEHEVPGFRAELRRTKNMPPFLTSPEHPAAQLLRAVAEGVSGRPVSFGTWRFGTDGTFIANEFGITTLGYGPGDEWFAHTPEEHLPVNQLFVARRVYAEFVRGAHRVL